MTRPRLIPALLLKHGLIVRSQLFKVHQVIGNPMSTVERFSHWNVDELIIIDISKEDFHDMRREDLHKRYSGTTSLDVLREVAKFCHMPLSFGGRIRTVEDIRKRVAAGADKIIINTQAIDKPEFITEASRLFGSQCIVVNIDVERYADGGLEVKKEGGATATGLDPVTWAQRVEELGAGEIFLNSIDRDGSAHGYDIDLVRSVSDAVSIPVIACGGVGSYTDFAPGILEGGAAAVSAANIFHFFELSYPQAKQACIDAGLPMREVKLGSRWFQREPVYNRKQEDERLEERLRQAREKDFKAARSDHERPQGRVTWCTRCVSPSISAAPMEFNDAGECTGCQTSGIKGEISEMEWARRRKLLVDIFEKYRCRDGSRHDCVIAVSGGKDSYFQTHVIVKEFGLNPLLVTYDANNWTDVGWRNMLRMKEVFGVDHVIVSPSVETLKKLNRLGLSVMGDMNWHCHVGITTTPVRVAAQNRIPLVIWGEHGYLDQCGQFSMDDFPEMSYRDRLEHFARGFEWNYFVGRDGLKASDLTFLQYPSDQTLFDLDIRGIYLGNYVYWEANDHTKMVIEKYGFGVSGDKFDRTYRTMSNLDDMHENGVHDYLKYIKFGYGRCTDHVCKDIRAGIMSREEGVKLVSKYDHVKPGDLARWLDYTGMGEEAFDNLCDTFRDPRVWSMQNGQWHKDTLRDE